MIRSSRNHAGDRFYSPPAMRRQQQRLQNQRNKTEDPKPVVSDSREPENRVVLDDSITKPSISSPEPIPPAGNLDRFLESTTPIVPAQYFSEAVGRWRDCEAENDPYFYLGDLWESFKEWSAYGAGVPLVLGGSDLVVQYYVPYLSGIQVYVDPSKHALRTRRPGEESDDDLYQDTSSDSSDLEAERRSKVGDGVLNQHNVDESNVQRINRLSLDDKTLPGQGNLYRNDGEVYSPRNLPIFEYLERDPPYSREPLADKVAVLSRQNPKLKAYRSCDLLPSSWISVAWYPIYRIPTGPTLQDLDACFLTFHSLSTPSKRGSIGLGQPHMHPIARNLGILTDTSPKLSLPIFGLASYKFKGSVWTPNGADEHLQSSLLQAADNWLRLLQVDHPDFRFFVSHSTYWR